MVTALRPLAFEDTKPKMSTLSPVDEDELLAKSASSTSFASCLSQPFDDDDDDDSSFVSACQSLDLSDGELFGQDAFLSVDHIYVVNCLSGNDVSLMQPNHISRFFYLIGGQVADLCTFAGRPSYQKLLSVNSLIVQCNSVNI